MTRKVGFFGFTACTVLLCLLMSSNSVRAAEIVGWGSQKTPNGPLNKLRVLAGGGIHSLALKTDGSLVAWGCDCYGEATPPSGNDYVAIAAGYYYSLALRTDGSILGWGQNYHGEATPPPGNDYIAIAAGPWHALALKADGSIVGWGNDNIGQTTPPAGNDYIAIAAGSFHSLALKADGSIVGWGKNDYGEATPPTGNDYIAIAAGSHFSLALKADGSIVGWGRNTYGQATPPAENDFVAIVAGWGRGHSLALKTDGSIVGWGWNDYGQATPPSGNDYVAIAAGSDHSLALKADGSIVGWGKNECGKAAPPTGNDYIAIAAGSEHDLGLRGNGSIVGWGNQTTPPAGNDYIAITAGSGYGLALKADGSIIGWGYNEYGQAAPPAGSDYIAIAAGYYHSLGLKSDGSIVGWGNNEYGQATPPAGDDYIAIAAGYRYNLALKADGSIVGWGDNEYGKATPPPGNNFIAITAGIWCSLALKADGSLVGWGRNKDGRASPPSGNDFVAIAAGSDHSLALKANGSIVGWGRNDFGQATPPTGNTYIAIAAGNCRSMAIRSGFIIPAQQVVFPSEWAVPVLSRPFTLHNYTNESVEWTLTVPENYPFLELDQECGTLDPNQSETVSVLVHVDTLPGGISICRLLLHFTIDDEPQVTPAILTIVGPTLELSRSNLTFIASESNPSMKSQSLTIRNTGGGILNWSIEKPEPDELPDWLSFGPMEGSLYPNETDQLRIDIDSTGLSKGFYVCNLILSPPLTENNPQTIEVMLLVLSGEEILVSLHYPTIQEAIDAAVEGDEIVVEPGIYDEDIDFEGKMIHLRSIAPDDPVIVSQTILTNKGWDGSIVRFTGNEEPNSILEGFSIARGYNITGGGGIFGNGTRATIRHCMIRENSSYWLNNSVTQGGGIYDCDGRIENCIISDNLSWNFGGGLAGCDGVIRNCTIVNNIARDNGGGLFECNAEIVNCIITNNEANSQGDQLYDCSVPMYSCYPGADGTNGNIDYDPLFADSGFTDANDTPQDPSDDHWVSFYQLQSEHGRWDPIARQWVYDDGTSPCIDAGDPTDPGWQNELWPHGGRINMGAYGGTPQAGMSPDPMDNIADLDHDDTVGIGDLSLFADDWLQWQILLDTDLDRNNRVNLFDFAILAENWLRP